MWPCTFEQRLVAWTGLREAVQFLPQEICLREINSWWFNSPWTPYHLHWDDRSTWPDPWQLLEDNIFCSVARSLGIMYTVVMLDRPDLQDTVMIDSENDNLVLVEQGKYILNWDRDTIVNTSSLKNKPRRVLTLQDLKKQVR
jgi:hypothetical protein